ncbi:MAG: agmatine deiminase family protein, partial [Chitinophagales bacterium]
MWIRDYGPWNIYKNNTDSLFLVDWIYNRPRPLDDAIPGVMSEYTGIPLYQTIEVPYDLVHTGGNFMTDGWGTGFSSKLVLEENDGFDYSLAPKSEQEIDSLMFKFMGINRYIKMETLPYDEIHHIDMHMKLLDEETLLIGEYPEGVADGPQIEENIQYIAEHFPSVFGTPYKIVRIPMPPDFEGQYPGDGPWWNTGDYRTYTNLVFVNKTVLVPVYEEKYDSTALRILQENLPGYKVVGIESNEIIQSLGAIHCITKEIAAGDPLLITHQPLKDTDNTIADYSVNCWILHNSGIEHAFVFYKTDTDSEWTETAMTLTDADSNTWEGFIPAYGAGTTVQYYIYAEAGNGKKQYRPITAPDGYWKFTVNDVTTDLEETFSLEDISVSIYPNPVADILSVKVSATHPFEMQFTVQNILGDILYTGSIHSGESNTQLIDFSQFPSGYYII